MGKRLKIDRDLCSGYALCLDAAPEVFDIDEHDVAYVRDPDRPIGEDEAAVTRAIKLCPVDAISLVDEG